MTPTEFDELYANRHQDAVLAECERWIDAMIADEVGTGDTSFEWIWRAARLEQFRAMQCAEAGDTGGAKAHFEAGAGYGRRAESLDGNRVEGVFWRATCELEGARGDGPLALARVLVGAQKRLDRACALDESFHQAGPLRVLGRLVQLKPLILGGNLDHALAFYDRALQIVPTNSTTLLYRADALILDRQPTLARQTLKTLLGVPSQGWVWECERDQKIARAWLESRFD